VEVLSPRLRDQRRDRVDKVRDYRTFGVGHYWIVDPQLRTVEFLRFAKPKNVLVETAVRGRVRPQGFRGLALDVDDLWRTVDSAEASPRKRRR
jgi:Uma2 family endonuclease